MNTMDNLCDLTDIQRRALETIANAPDLSRTFYLTGGTLLKALGIVPRESNDLDLFTFPAIEPIEYTKQLGNLHNALNTTFGESAIRTTDRGFLYQPDGMIIDAIHDMVPNIDDFVAYGSLRTAGLRDAAAGKVSAFCSRDELKDYVDIAFLTKYAGWTLKDLADIAEEKFKLGTMPEEKLLMELLAKQAMFDTIPQDIFLRDGKDNITLIKTQIQHLLSTTTL